jgi:hypothetical protein
MGITRSYLGGEAGIEIKPLDKLARSQERMNDFITRAEELKFKVFQENKDWFLKESKIDPKVFINQKHAEVQQQLLDEYNQFAADIIKSSGGFEGLGGKQQLLLQQKRLA